METKPTDITDELIASMQEAAAIVQGEAEPARVQLPPDVPDVRALRARLGLSRTVIGRSPDVVAATVAEVRAA